MKLKVRLYAVLFLFFGINGNTQVLSTKEAKVILVVSEREEAVSHIELFNNFQLMKRAVALEKYPNCQFYIGLLIGSYELNENIVVPLKGSSVIVYTDRQYLSDNSLFPNARSSFGKQLNLGSAKAKVISNKKGELILKTQ
jgi:hypothetical protein